MKARKAARQKERERAKEREKRQQAASMLREYQKKKKLEAELAKLQEVEQRKKKIASTFQVHAERNPGRLLQSTMSQIHRGATPRDSENSNNQVNYIRNVTHLAVPAWRSNLPRGLG